MRQLTAAFLPGAFLYTLLIAKMQNWGAFGWGPRYLLPIVPVLALAAAPIALKLWRASSSSRALLVALLTLSVLLSIPPTLVNWRLVTVETPDGLRSDAPYPAQQAAVWKSLWLGIQGKPLPGSEKAEEIAEDPIRSGSARFPDLWLVRIGERSFLAAIFAVLIALALAAINAISFLRILWLESRALLPKRPVKNPQKPI